MSELDRFPVRSSLAVEARRLSRDEFVAKHPGPALELKALGGGPASASGGDATPSARELSYRRTVVSEEGVTAAGAYDGRVVFILKRPGNPFPNIVTLGRAMNNDLVFALGTISKVHGMFWLEGASCSYTDQKSTNGTLVNGKPLATGERRKLADGDVLTLGNDLEATFRGPAAFFERLRRPG